MAKRNTSKKYNSAFNTLFAWYKRNAKKSNVEFKLSREHFHKLINQNCFYCGNGPSQVVAKNGSLIRYNGLDRVRHKVGYLSRNVVTACRACNFLKHQNSTEEFLSSVERIARFFLKLG